MFNAKYRVPMIFSYSDNDCRHAGAMGGLASPSIANMLALGAHSTSSMVASFSNANVAAMATAGGGGGGPPDAHSSGSEGNGRPPRSTLGAGVKVAVFFQRSGLIRALLHYLYSRPPDLSPGDHLYILF